MQPLSILCSRWFTLEKSSFFLGNSDISLNCSLISHLTYFRLFVCKMMENRRLKRSKKIAGSRTIQ